VSLIADGGEHTCIFVQLTNARGEPIPAPDNVTVILTSSKLNVGTVQNAITIVEGSSFANATFTTTKYSGTTLITATASGYMTSGAEITTIAPATSSHLRVYPLPSIAPAVNGTKGKVVIEILNEDDIPYAPTENITLTLATNSSMVKIDATTIIPAGSYFIVVNYTITGNFTIPSNSSRTHFDDNVTISALAQGFKPGESSINVRTPGNEASTLLLELGPSIVLPKDSLQNSAVVTLLDKTNNPICVNGSLSISVSSSADKTVAKVQKSVTIENNTCSAYLNITSLGVGTSLIAASAQGLLMDTNDLVVVGSIPSALLVYITPEYILTGDSLKPVLTVLTIDQYGKPIAVEDDVNVFLSSSYVEVASIAQFTVIPAGHYYSQIHVDPEVEAGTIDITASARNFEPSTNTMSTLNLIMNATLSATRPTAVNDTILVSITVDRFGDPISGVSSEFSVLGGVIVTKDDKSNSNGLITATIRQTSATMKIVAQLSKSSYKDVSLTKISTVPTQQSTELSINIFGFSVSLFYIIVGIGVAVILVFAVYIFLKYRRKNTDKLEVVG
jgi:hypothetical protein